LLEWIQINNGPKIRLINSIKSKEIKRLSLTPLGDDRQSRSGQDIYVSFQKQDIISSDALETLGDE